MVEGRRATDSKILPNPHVRSTHILTQSGKNHIQSTNPS